MLILLLVFFISSCGLDNSKIDIFLKQREKKRYNVYFIKPPIVFSDAMAIDFNGGSPPILWISDNKKKLFESGPVNESKYYDFPGLGLDQEIFESKKSIDEYINKSSMIWEQDGDNLVIDYYYENPLEKKTTAFLHHLYTDCRYQIADGFSCRRGEDRPRPPGKWFTIWHDLKDPVVEMSTGSYYGIYAITKGGKLIAVEKEDFGEVIYAFLHDDLKFIKNSENRYFINAPSNYLCMQTADKTVYCSEQNVLEYGSGQYGVVNNKYPMLAKVATLDFFVKEVAFGGRHFCFLAENRDVWCQGDNGCGQITGRHDEEQIIKKPRKINFLDNKVRSITAHAAGNCALLVDGRVQCWGLGASVIREKLLEDKAYSKSFSWFHGYRPWQICLGGAENGI